MVTVMHLPFQVMENPLLLNRMPLIWLQEDKNGVRDVFIWNAATNTIKKVSKGGGGKDANADSYEPSVSGEGNLVAFTSTASNISTTEKGVSNNNVFLYDVQNDKSIMISIDPISRKGGTVPNRPSLTMANGSLFILMLLR